MNIVKHIFCISFMLTTYNTYSMFGMGSVLTAKKLPSWIPTMGDQHKLSPEKKSTTPKTSPRKEPLNAENTTEQPAKKCARRLTFEQ